MDIMARVSQSAADPKALDASMERISEQDNVVLARAGIVRDRAVGEFSASRIPCLVIEVALQWYMPPRASGRQPYMPLKQRQHQ